MINDMRQLALIKLNYEFHHDEHLDISQLRQQHAKELAQYLVENVEKIPRVYVLSPVSGKENTVRLSSLELDEEKRQRLPFVKPSGSQSAAVGPVIKRTFKSKEKPPYGPTAKILNSSLKEFIKLATTPSPWQSYFQKIVAILNSQILLFEQEHSISAGSSVLIKAVELINEKETVFLTVATDQNGQEFWPGDRSEYHEYLAHELANIKYVTKDTPFQENGICSLCGKTNTTVYPNAIKGAGLNISNADRAGAFCELDTKQAWKNYALCLDCADLLFIFKNYVLPDLVSEVAGDKALILPSLIGDIDRNGFIEDWRKYLKRLQNNQDIKQNIEKDILEFFKEQTDAHLLLHIIWADFGQNMENVNHYITDILPSRLYQLSEIHSQAKKWQFALFPKIPLDEVEFGLHLNMLWYLLKRPGYGKKVKNANKSKKLKAIRQQLADNIYHDKALAKDDEQNLWNEITITAQWYFADALQQNQIGQIYGLCHEGYSDKKAKKYWTLAGWIRHLARFFYYLDQTGVLPMSKADTRTFQPQMAELKPFFTPKSGIDSNEKALAFLIGILYGKLLQVQSAREVNVTSSTLPWLKRLQLSGKDLPELYAKICHKFLTYGNPSDKTRQVIRETAQVGTLVGDNVVLDITKTVYFLLLGQALAVEILPAKSKSASGEVNG